MINYIVTVHTTSIYVITFHHIAQQTHLTTLANSIEGSNVASFSTNPGTEPEAEETHVVTVKPRQGYLPTLPPSLPDEEIC